MSVKQATEELLKIAEEIEKDAAEVTQFVCAKCNHTATLASINMKRKEAADAAAQNTSGTVTVAEVTVNDKVFCPACNGVMAYQETEASAPYYFDPEKQAKEPEAEPEKKPEEPAAPGAPAPAPETKEATIDYDSLQRYASVK